jgi:HTH-type transcriptional regulator / antitoxin MqsA
MEHCPFCKGAVDLRSEDRDVDMLGRRVLVPHDFYFCGRCKEDFFTPEQMDAVQRTASTVIRDAEGLLHSEEIKRIRKKFRLSQPQMEKVIGTGPKTYGRWERGTVFQSKTVDRLLRILDKYPDVACWLAAQSAVEINTAFVWFTEGAYAAPMPATIVDFDPFTDQAWPMVQARHNPGALRLPARELRDLVKGAA